MVSRTGVYGLRFSGSAHLVLRVHAQSLQAPASDQIYAEAPNECLTKAATEPDQNYKMPTLWGPRRCSIVLSCSREVGLKWMVFGKGLRGLLRSPCNLALLLSILLPCDGDANDDEDDDDDGDGDRDGDDDDGDGNGDGDYGDDEDEDDEDADDD